MSVKKEEVNLGRAGHFQVKKGALHRALGVAEGKKIPQRMLTRALHSKNKHLAAMARSAKGFKAMHHGD